jgi:hypothetical protein
LNYPTLSDNKNHADGMNNKIKPVDNKRQPNSEIAKLKDLMAPHVPHKKQATISNFLKEETINYESQDEVSDTAADKSNLTRVAIPSTDINY